MKVNPSIISLPLYGVYKLWNATLRHSEEGREAVDAYLAGGKPMVFSLWHDELFPAAKFQRGVDVVAVISQSNDGEILARLLERLGIRTARGSSSRGGVKALLSAARLMRKEGVCSAITVDGPRGPRHKVKDGAIFLAYKAKAPIVPVRIRMSRAYVFTKAWDRFQLPLPFSSVHTSFGTPIVLPEPAGGGKIDQEYLKVHSAQLEQRMLEL